MVYMAANNNLEPNSVYNLMEMAEIGSSASTNIVVQITRPPEYTGYYGEWGGTRRFLVTPSDQKQLSAGDFQVSGPRLAAYLNAVAEDAGISPATIDQVRRAPRDQAEKFAQQLVPPIDPKTPLPFLQIKSVQDLGTSVNSGQAASLTDFGKWAVQNYPAQHYALIMWDHGGGWSMIASDDTLGAEGIPMPDFQNALKDITAAAGVSKLDVIGFDACLMAQMPVAVTVAPYADYMIASEELVPGLGWNYTPPIQAITSGTDVSPVDIGHAVVEFVHDAVYDDGSEERGQFLDDSARPFEARRRGEIARRVCPGLSGQRGQLGQSRGRGAPECPGIWQHRRSK